MSYARHHTAQEYRKNEKCLLFEPIIEYLGHKLSLEKLEIDQANEHSLCFARPPITKT